MHHSLRFSVPFASQHMLSASLRGASGFRSRITLPAWGVLCIALLLSAILTRGMSGSATALGARPSAMAWMCGAAALLGGGVLLSGRHGVSGRETSQQTHRDRRLSRKLQRAMRTGDVTLVYQPIFNAQQIMVAVEVLARWHDPEMGTVSPVEFIPAAEATGAIVPFSRWVLRRACEQMATWQAMGSALERVAVNVSVRHAALPDFPFIVQQILSDTGLAATRLELELTEGALTMEFDSVVQNLQVLQAMGVRVSIDDFGTGYSSFSRTRDLKAEVLKIDRSFVQAVTDFGRGAAVVRAMIQMAHAMQLSVVAEGVETLDQLNTLEGMDCDELQGFLLGLPQSPEAITAQLRDLPVVSFSRGPASTPRLPEWVM